MVRGFYLCSGLNKARNFVTKYLSSYGIADLWSKQARLVSNDVRQFLHRCSQIVSSFSMHCRTVNTKSCLKMRILMVYPVCKIFRLKYGCDYGITLFSDDLLLQNYDLNNVYYKIYTLQPQSWIARTISWRHVIISIKLRLQNVYHKAKPFTVRYIKALTNEEIKVFKNLFVLAVQSVTYRTWFPVLEAGDEPALRSGVSTISLKSLNYWIILNQSANGNAFFVYLLFEAIDPHSWISFALLPCLKWTNVKPN